MDLLPTHCKLTLFRINCTVCVLLVLFVSLQCSLSLCFGNISMLEYEALQDVYFATEGPNWTLDANESKWLFPSSLSAPCVDHWQGINCRYVTFQQSEAASCTVVALRLPFTNLQGTIPATIANLTSLSELNLNQNFIVGIIPSRLGKLSLLEILDLSNNYLTGTISSQLGKCSSLKVLSLYKNSLTGPIPQEVGQLTFLTQLGFDVNFLSGSIPSSLGNLVDLTRFFMYVNALSGPIPSSIGNLKSLVVLDFDTNALTGSIPSEIGNLAAVSKFFLFSNYLTGSIPSAVGDMKSLTELAFNENSLTGTIPFQLGDVSKLTELNMYSNSLTGTIPSTFSGLKKLSSLYLYSNSLSHTIPTVVGNLTTMVYLGLNDNFLTGSIPIEFGRLVDVFAISIDSNILTGTLPAALGDLHSISQLYLDGNYFTGSLSTTLSNLTALSQLYMSVNMLTGPVLPTWSTLMSSFELAFNAFTGTIPVEMGQLSNCFRFNLSGNSLTGSIPLTIGSIGSQYSNNGSAFGVVMDLSLNSFTGTLPPSLFSPQMQTISLHDNCFHGSLPAQLCLSTQLQTLVLDKLTSGDSCEESFLPGFNGTFAKFLMEGTIPKCVWNLPQLRTLHLSGNGLHGTIADLSSSSLVNIDVSNNYLSGSIPLALQQLVGLQQLALANNKLSGQLSASFDVGNLTLLTLSVNRLSGDVPPSFVSTSAALSIEVLTGNLFACGSALPKSDPSYNSYVCGSSTMNYGLYTWIACCVFQLVVGAAAAVLLSAFSDSSAWRVCIDRGLSWWRYSSECVDAKASTCASFVSMTEKCRLIITCIGLTYLVLVMPVYMLLKLSGQYGTVSNQYTWVTTAAFLHGTAAATLIGLFVTASTGGLSFILLTINCFSSDIGISTEGLVEVKKRRVRLSRCVLRLLIQLTNVIVVVTTNVLYVYALLSNILSTGDVVALQVTMSVFKLLWKKLFVELTAVPRIRKHADISPGAALYHEVMMNVFIFILAPCIATLGTDSDCLYNIIHGEQQIVSLYNITEFNSLCVTYSNDTTQCSQVPYQQQETIIITPPWLYSYQCTSALLTNYVPVLIFTYAVNGVLTPLFSTGSLLLTTRDSHPLLNYLANKLFDGRSLVMDMLVDVVILMTFGLASPLLALAIVLKQVNYALKLRLWIGRFLLESESLHDALSVLDTASHSFQGEAVAMATVLILVVSVFWGGLVFDIVADVYGSVTGFVVSGVLVVIWCVSVFTVLVLLKRMSGVRTVGAQLAIVYEVEEATGSHLATHSLNAVFDSHRNSEVEMSM